MTLYSSPRRYLPNIIKNHAASTPVNFINPVSTAPSLRTSDTIVVTQSRTVINPFTSMLLQSPYIRRTGVTNNKRLRKHFMSQGLKVCIETRYMHIEEETTRSEA